MRALQITLEMFLGGFMEVFLIFGSVRKFSEVFLYAYHAYLVISQLFKFVGII